MEPFDNCEIGMYVYNVFVIDACLKMVIENSYELLILEHLFKSEIS